LSSWARCPWRCSCGGLESNTGVFVFHIQELSMKCLKSIFLLTSLKPTQTISSPL
jgi:hypothetical protein